MGEGGSNSGWQAENREELPREGGGKNHQEGMSTKGGTQQNRKGGGGDRRNKKREGLGKDWVQVGDSGRVVPAKKPRQLQGGKGNGG